MNARKVEARAARRQTETALVPDVRRWPCSIGVSRLLDLWLVPRGARRVTRRRPPKAYYAQRLRVNVKGSPPKVRALPSVRRALEDPRA